MYCKNSLKFINVCIVCGGLFHQECHDSYLKEIVKINPTEIYRRMIVIYIKNLQDIMHNCILRVFHPCVHVFVSKRQPLIHSKQKPKSICSTGTCSCLWKYKLWRHFERPVTRKQASERCNNGRYLVCGVLLIIPTLFPDNEKWC